MRRHRRALRYRLPVRWHARLPQVDDAAGTPVYVIDPNGFVVLRYPPQTDPAGIRADVARLLKLK